MTKSWYEPIIYGVRRLVVLRGLSLQVWFWYSALAELWYIFELIRIGQGITCNLNTLLTCYTLCHSMHISYHMNFYHYYLIQFWTYQMWIKTRCPILIDSKVYQSSARVTKMWVKVIFGDYRWTKFNKS